MIFLAPESMPFLQQLRELEGKGTPSINNNSNLYTVLTTCQALLQAPYIYIYQLLWWFSGKRICLPMQNTRVWSLGGEDPLEKEMATHSSILAWGISWTGSLVGYSPWGHKRVRHDLRTKQQQNLIWQTRKARHTEVRSLREGLRSGPWRGWYYSNLAPESLPLRHLYSLACFPALPAQGFDTAFWLVW